MPHLVTSVKYILDFPYQTGVQTVIYDKIASKAPCLTTLDRANWRNPMGEKAKEVLKLQFDKRLRLEFHGASITSDAGLLACRELEGCWD